MAALGQWERLPFHTHVEDCLDSSHQWVWSLRRGHHWSWLVFCPEQVGAGVLLAEIRLRSAIIFQVWKVHLLDMWSFNSLWDIWTKVTCIWVQVNKACWVLGENKTRVTNGPALRPKTEVRSDLFSSIRLKYGWEICISFLPYAKHHLRHHGNQPGSSASQPGRGTGENSPLGHCMECGLSLGISAIFEEWHCLPKYSEIYQGVITGSSTVTHEDWS